MSNPNVKDSLSTMYNVLAGAGALLVVGTMAGVLAKETFIKSMAQEAEQEAIQLAIDKATLDSKKAIGGFEQAPFDLEGGANPSAEFIKQSSPELTRLQKMFGVTWDNVDLDDRVSKTEGSRIMQEFDTAVLLETNIQSSLANRFLFSVEHPADVAFMMVKWQQQEAMNPHATHLQSNGAEVSVVEQVLLQESREAYDATYGEGSFAKQEARWGTLEKLGEELQGLLKSSDLSQEEAKHAKVVYRHLGDMLINMHEKVGAPLVGSDEATLASQFIAMQAVALRQYDSPLPRAGYLNRSAHQIEGDIMASEVGRDPALKNSNTWSDLKEVRTPLVGAQEHNWADGQKVIGETSLLLGEMAQLRSLADLIAGRRAQQDQQGTSVQSAPDKPNKHTL